MKKVIIFGTGKSTEKIISNINNKNAEIIGFADNDPQKAGKIFHGKKIYTPIEILELKFDIIIIGSIKYESITEQLMGLGIKISNIFEYFSFDHQKYIFIREIIFTEGMIYDELESKFLHMNRFLENYQYELADKVMKKKLRIPHIKTIDDTIRDISEKHLSISRYGDLDFDIILQDSINYRTYQRADKKLAARLMEILVKPIDGHVVGLADIFGELDFLEDKYADYFRDFMLKYREKYYGLLDLDRVYYNAFISRFYSELKDKSQAKKRFEGMMYIWENREIVVVEGDKTRVGVGNNLFSHVKSCERILCPSENAFDRYDDIFHACLDMPQNKLFILALGSTATVLAYDLTKEGYQAIDIGHFDIEYEWFIRGVTEHKIAVPGKYTNEVVGGNIVEDVWDEEYCSQIIKRLTL